MRENSQNNVEVRKYEYLDQSTLSEFQSMSTIPHRAAHAASTWPELLQIMMPCRDDAKGKRRGGRRKAGPGWCTCKIYKIIL